ncbi:MAG: triose-phosphate isomerase [Victivallaceae bacterium]|nr:triose-phosphate isomerase [Victivallaceae bacterium]
MSRKIIVAGNWKMNKNAAEGKALVEALKGELADISFDDADVVVCPPFTTLGSVIEAAACSRIGVGAQNIHWAASGAFTGEISADMLVSSGVKYVIIGHSERRQYFGETDATVNSRLKAALGAGLTPIVCVGETLAEREGNRTEAVLARQIREGFAGIDAAVAPGIVVAYEPVWAIGTGKTATPDVAQAAHAFIRSELAGVFGTEAAEAIRIQYGGSMKSENARELLSQPDIDGGLIGGAALKADSFAKLIREAIAGSKN